MENFLLGILFVLVLPNSIFCDQANYSINELRATIELDKRTASANVHIKAALSGVKHATGSDSVLLDLNLMSPDGEDTAQTTITWFEPQSDKSIGHAILPIENPLHWTAETPHLYRLSASLIVGERSIQNISIYLGIREISIEHGIMLLNGTPITIRGINYGIERNTSEDAQKQRVWLNDLELMKSANCNAVLTNGQTPANSFLELCDKIGMYVFAQLPISDKSDIEQKINRCANHASLFAWNLGANQPWNDNLNDAVQYIKELDATRPLFIAGNADVSLPEVIDILAPGNIRFEEMRGLSKKHRSIIATYFSPALENSMEGLEDFRRMTGKHPQLTGVFVKQLYDLSTKDVSSLTTDNKEQKYQLDYHQVQKAFSPIWIEQIERKIKTGKQVVELTLGNDFDFTNLREIDCKRFLLRDGKIVEQNTVRIDLEPGEDMELAATLEIPEDFSDHNYNLLYRFFDSSGRKIYEQSIRLRPWDLEKSFINRLRDLKWDKEWNVFGGPLEGRIEHKNYFFNIQLATTGWFMRTQDHNVRLISGGPFIRLARKESKADQLHYGRDGSPVLHQPLISDLWVESKSMEKIGKNVEFYTTMIERQPMDAYHPVKADIDILSSPFGYSDIRFKVHTGDNDKVLQEVGLAFVVPSTLNRIAWIGDGPYPSYPGQSILNNWGLHEYYPISDIAPGNRSRVSTMAFLDKRGYGLGVMMLDGNISIEQVSDGTLVSINSAVAGLGNGAFPTRFPITIKELNKKPATSFRLIPLIRGKYPTAFKWLK